MLNVLLSGGLVSLFNFGIHALMTGVIVVITRHIAGRTDDMHVFLRVTALMMITVTTLTLTHVLEIFVWSAFIEISGVTAPNLEPFEFAFENFTALGYGDVVAAGGWRLAGPVMALNGLLLMGWSVAIIFEVLKMADVQIGRAPRTKKS